MAQNDAITNQVTKISLAGKTLSLLTSGTAKGRDKIGLSESFPSENLLDFRTIARLTLSEIFGQKFSKRSIQYRKLDYSCVADFSTVLLNTFESMSI